VKSRSRASRRPEPPTVGPSWRWPGMLAGCRRRETPAAPRTGLGPKFKVCSSKFVQGVLRKTPKTVAGNLCGRRAEDGLLNEVAAKERIEHRGRQAEPLKRWSGKTPERHLTMGLPLSPTRNLTLTLLVDGGLRLRVRPSTGGTGWFRGSKRGALFRRILTPARSPDEAEMEERGGARAGGTP